MANALEDAKGLTMGQMAALVRKMGGFDKAMAVLRDEAAVTLTNKIPDADIARREWERFYREVYHLETDLSKVAIPEEEEGFEWLVVVAKELGDNPHNKVRAVHPLETGIGFDIDLDTTIESCKRDCSCGSYAVRTPSGMEVDERTHGSVSVDDATCNWNCMTLLEYLLLVGFIFWKTDKTLDVNNWIMCAGTVLKNNVVACIHPIDDCDMDIELLPATFYCRSLCVREVKTV